MKLIIKITIYIFIITAITIIVKHFKKIENFEGSGRPATEEDILKGLTYSMYKKCVNNGYSGILTSDTSFDCEHTKVTCLKDSKEDNPFNYYIWKDEECQLGNLNFKKFCDKENLDYTDKGECKTNQKYCNSKKEEWRGTDCKINGGQWTSEAIFGKTITRGIKDIFV